jgi:hypothetical protein
MNLVRTSIAFVCACSCSSRQATPWTPTFDAPAAWLLDTWGANASDVYAVGGTESTATVMHFDGTSWSPLSLGVDAPLLNWCFGFASDDVTMVGNTGTVLHFDGNTWSVQPTPTTQNLWGVWGASPNDLWSVGGDGLEASQATLLHFDGTTWSAVAIPTLQKANVWQFLKVWGTSASNVYVVGQRGVVMHFDGTNWSELLVGASDDLVSLWGTDADHIVAVGGRGNGIVSVWNGSTWTTTPLSPTPGLNGVWMRTPNVAHVVGEYGTLADIDLATMTLTPVTPMPTTLDFHSIFGDENGKVYAVGGNLGDANPESYQGVAYTRMLGGDE